MGLDMYAYRTKEVPDKPVSFAFKEKPEELAYWRKFNNLHGWMKRLYEKKGGTEEFNCQSVVLAQEDLDQLEADTRLKKLEPTEGFFFGISEPFDDSMQEEVLEFIQKARAALAEGYTVFYDSWW